MPCRCGAVDHPELTDVPFDASKVLGTCWLFSNDSAYRDHFNGSHLPFRDNKTRQMMPGAMRLSMQQTPSAPVAYPSAAEMAVNVAAATAQWIAAGRPTRSDEECRRIHLICVGCEWFDRDQDRCKKCGCGLSSESKWSRFMPIPDGIKMATHHCPITKW
jgi:hypothetical protein